MPSESFVDREIILTDKIKARREYRASNFFTNIILKMYLNSKIYV